MVLLERPVLDEYDDRGWFKEFKTLPSFFNTNVPLVVLHKMIGDARSMRRELAGNIASQGVTRDVVYLG